MAVNETILIDFTDILNNNPSDAYVAVYVNSSNNVGNGRNLSKRYIKKSLLASLLLQTNGVNNPLQSVLNLIAGSNITLTPNGVGGVTIDASGGGSSILLQTDGVNNPTQNILNLVEGTNMTITDDGLGNITFDASGGGGGTYTVNNGLTESPANNFQWGGTLIQNTTITSLLFDIIFTGTKPSRTQFVLDVQNTSTGSAIRAQANGGTGIALNAIATGGTAILATSTNAEAITANSINGNGAYIQAYNGQGLFVEGGTYNEFTMVLGGAATVDTILKLKKFIGSNSVIGGGVAIDLWAGKNGSGAVLLTGKIASVYEVVTNFNESASLEFTTVGSGAAAINMILRGSGQLRLNKYGIGTFASPAVYLLGVDASGNVVETTASGTGTVTSVDLTMPAAFSVTGNPITTSGTLAVAAAGLSTQYIRGDGQLANFPTSGGGGSSINYYLNGSVSQGTFGGVAFREMSRTPIFGAGTNFSINADGYIQSFITDANDPNQLLIPAGNWIFEMYFNASSGGGSPSFYVELYKWDGTTLTLIATSSANPENITNGTTVDLYTTALAVPSTVLAATDRLAVRVYVTHSGRTITLHTEDNNLCEIITTFSTGLTALNGLTEQVQFLAVGTSGTDFAINSTGSTHTFNLPTASAANRGALSSADWSTFNSKFNTPAGTTSQYVRGDGSLAAFPNVPAFLPYITEVMSSSTATNNSIEYVASVNKIYVTNGGNNVNIFNATTGELLATVPLTQAFRARYIASKNEVWVTSVNVASITRIDPTANTVILPAITTSIEANGFDICEISSTKVYVSIITTGAQKIQVIDPSPLIPIWVANIVTNVPGFASGMAFNNNPSSAQNGIVLLGSSGGAVTLVNSTTNTVVVGTTNTNPSSALSAVFEIMYSTADDKYYVSSQANNRVVSLNITGATTLTLDKIKHSATLCISLQIDDSNDLLIINQVAGTGNLNNMCHFIRKSTFDSLYNLLIPALGGGNSRSGYIRADLANKRVFLAGRSSGSTAVVTVKY